MPDCDCDKKKAIDPEVSDFGPDVWVHPDIEKLMDENDSKEADIRLTDSVIKSSPGLIVDGQKRLTGFKPSHKQYEGVVFRDFPIWRGRSAGIEPPDELDYTVIAPPKVVAQQCGDCWAQGAAMAFEGVIGWLDKASRDISRQSIIDCSGSGSCGGGYATAVRFFEAPNKGAVYTSDYPYKGYDQKCRTASLIRKEQARSTGFIRSSGGGRPTVPDLQRALMETGPLEVCGAASSLGGSDRDGFILSNRPGGTNHCYALYGWLDGAKHGKPAGIYGIIVNSWGKEWAKGGIVYVRLAKDNINLDGSVITEAAYIDYKDPVPPEPLLMDVKVGKANLKIRIEPKFVAKKDMYLEQIKKAISIVEGK